MSDAAVTVGGAGAAAGWLAVYPEFLLQAERV